MSKIKNVTGDIQIYGSGASIIEFKELEKVEGNVIFNENTKLTQISLPLLKETGSLEFKVLPREFSSISVPDIVTVNGNLSIESIYGEVETAGMRFFMGNTELKSIEGFDKLTSVTGVWSIKNFDVLEKLPKLQGLNQLGGVVIRQLALIESLDISNVSFTSSSPTHPCITIEYCNKFNNLITKEDLTDVDVRIISLNTAVKTNFTKINNFYYEANIDTFESSLQSITGNLSIIQISGQSSKNTIDLSGINSIPGYLLIITVR